jgi:transcriptional regulator with XRE-family HTH domain
MALKRRKHPPDPRIRTRIKAAMERHGMNQVELAEMLGLTQASVSLFLAGHTRPKDDTVRRIADGLGEDFDYLMGYKNTGSKGTGRIIGHILGKSTPEELELLRDIPDDDYHEMMGELALKYRKRKRKRPGRGVLACFGVIASVILTAIVTAMWEHGHHEVEPLILLDHTPWGGTHDMSVPGPYCPPGSYSPQGSPVLDRSRTRGAR